ncbi:hypothetical protein FOZ63_006069, partial [Perkinsus olseni]
CVAKARCGMGCRSNSHHRHHENTIQVPIDKLQHKVTDYSKSIPAMFGGAILALGTLFFAPLRFFDWYMEYAEIVKFLPSADAIHDVLMVGCGNSRLPEQLVKRHGFRHVCCIGLSKRGSNDCMSILLVTNGRFPGSFPSEKPPHWQLPAGPSAPECLRIENPLTLSSRMFALSRLIDISSDLTDAESMSSL